MTDAIQPAGKVALLRVADAAKRQGKPWIVEACSSALGYIEHLESEQARTLERRRRAGYARAAALTPERRSEIASLAGRCRQVGQR